MGEIIAMGGGGFSMEPDNLALDRYVLAQSPATRPKVCFVPTASGDSDLYIKNFYVAFSTLDCQPTHLSLFRQDNFNNLETFVMAQDIIYVGGGNTRNMIVLWREWGLDHILGKALANGTILSGLSAGAICWFQQGSTDSSGTLSTLECLGFLPGSCCPHYDGEAERRPSYKRMIAEGAIKAGYGIQDSAALHFRDGDLQKCVCSVKGKTAFALSAKNGAVIETPVGTEYIGP